MVLPPFFDGGKERKEQRRARRGGRIIREKFCLGIKIMYFCIIEAVGAYVGRSFVSIYMECLGIL